MKQSKSGSDSLSIESLRVRDERKAGQGPPVCNAVAMRIYQDTKSGVEAHERVAAGGLLARIAGVAPYVVAVRGIEPRFDG
jgi:hypothetical protein